MSNKRYLIAFIPAAILCSVLLVGLEQSGRQSSAPAPDVTVNPIGATGVSLTASASPAVPDAAWGEAGSGGDGGRLSGSEIRPLTPTPASTTVVSSALVSPLPTKESASEFNQRAEVAQLVEQRTPNPQVAGSSPVLSANDLMSAIEAAFPPSEVETAYRVAMCESGGDPTEVGAAGEEGAFQVLAVFHGEVPADIYGQAEQAAGIVAEQGWGPWSCQ
jgi:hypothetical protein